MNNKISSKFLVGLLFGIMAGFVIWYWQKSTSAEDGALALLDRLAVAENKLRRLGEQRPRGLEEHPLPVKPAKIKESATQEQTDDMTQVRGIGPVFADRLRQAGIVTHGQLASTSREQLARILGASVQRSESILEEARRLSS